MTARTWYALRTRDGLALVWCDRDHRVWTKQIGPSEFVKARSEMVRLGYRRVPAPPEV